MSGVHMAISSGSTSTCVVMGWVPTGPGRLDTLLHSIAFAPKADLHGRVVDCSAEGFSLYLRDGHACFAARYQGKLFEATADKPLPAPRCTLQLTLSKNGRLYLEAEGCPLLDEQTPGLLPRMPLDGLQIGRDEKGAVGEYAAPFAFEGKLGRVVIELD